MPPHGQTFERSPQNSNAAAPSPPQHAADTIYAVATDESVFLRLTRECGWTPVRYADLIARTLKASLGKT